VLEGKKKNFFCGGLRRLSAVAEREIKNRRLEGLFPGWGALKEGPHFCFLSKRKRTKGKSFIFCREKGEAGLV